MILCQVNGVDGLEVFRLNAVADDAYLRAARRLGVQKAFQLHRIKERDRFGVWQHLFVVAEHILVGAAARGLALQQHPAVDRSAAGGVGVVAKRHIPARNGGNCCDGVGCCRFCRQAEQLLRLLIAFGLSPVLAVLPKQGDRVRMRAYLRMRRGMIEAVVKTLNLTEE